MEERQHFVSPIPKGNVIVKIEQAALAGAQRPNNHEWESSRAVLTE